MRCVVGFAFLTCFAGCSGCDVDPVTPTETLFSTSPREINFTDTVLGDNADAVLLVENVGERSIDIALALESQGDAPAFRVEDALTLTLAVGASDSVAVRYVPLTLGEHDAVLTLEAEGQRAEVPLRGRAIPVPPCDDSNECTDDRYDFDQDACVYEVHERVCGEDNLCLVNARCFMGACVGETVSCAPAQSDCMQPACLPDEGCVTVDIPGACDDGDPCTEDTCTLTGCVNPPTMEGTVCP